MADEAFIVRAARGHQRRDGGVVFSGMLYKGDAQVASFHNDGNGGCNYWTIVSTRLFAQFKAEAVKACPNDKFEQEDVYVGTLWDAAYLAANQPKERKGRKCAS